MGRFSKVLERIDSRRIGTEANRCGLSFGGGSGDQTTTEAATSPTKAATSPTEIKKFPTPVKKRRRRVGFQFEEIDLEIKASPSLSPSNFWFLFLISILISEFLRRTTAEQVTDSIAHSRAATSPTERARTALTKGPSHSFLISFSFILDPFISTGRA